MSWVKFRIEVHGKNEILELNYTTFRQSLSMRKLSDRIILSEGGITREMPPDEFKDWLISVISMLDHEDQKEIVESVAAVVFN